MTQVAITTLGCRTNQEGSSALARLLAAQGFTVVPFPGPADAVVVNTCTVTSGADADSRRAIRRAVAAAPGALVLVTGCYAQVSPQAAALPGVHYVVGHGAARRIPELIALGRPSRVTVLAPSLPRRLDDEPLAHGPADGRTRAFLKVQDGCDAFCSFCIVPFARGRSRSLPIAAAVARLRALALEGYREVTVTGIHLGDYGRGLAPGTDLVSLVRALLEADVVPRLRLSSLFPSHLTDDLVRLFATAPALVPHVHLSLQSGDDGVLARMRRPYRRADVERAVGRLVERVPDVGLGADLIAGFPGETPEAAAATVSLVESLPFGYLHVFPYSARRGTPAARQGRALRPDEVRRRAARLREVAAGRRAAWHRRAIGRVVEVLVEAGGEGRSREYLKVRFDGRPAPPAGRLVRAEVTADLGEAVLARALE
ncbi:MAG TPA: tRNA (N(6)-L-threonylcarbamoyladenosine(37)-C(2))-methylthiotransferase MtaB [Thermodesulfobacteriota bacterium]